MKKLMAVNLAIFALPTMAVLSVATAPFIAMDSSGAAAMGLSEEMASVSNAVKTTRVES
jgi:hypothetical protein